ncbi:partial glutamate dehydrogenase, partial [biofilm metagenome]
MNVDERLTKQSKLWQNRFQALAMRALGEKNGKRLVQKFTKAFPADYRSLISPRYALNDILQLERLSASDDLRISLVRPHPKNPDYRLHFYSLRNHFLDEFIPLLENMSLRVVDQVQFSFGINNTIAAVKSFTIKAAKSQCAPFSLLSKRLLETIQAVMESRVENDALNKLCVLTGLGWQEIDVLRAYRNYYLQLGHRTTQASFHHAL